MLRAQTRRGRLAVLPPFIASLACGCSGEPAAVPRAAPEVVTLTVQPESVRLQVELPGRVAAQSAAEVRPQVGGIIRERLFVEGAMVQAGQTLYRIDPAPFAAALERAEAAHASAVAAARISELQVQRYRQLLPERTISQQDFDNAEATHAQSLATVQERAATVRAARIDLQWTRVAAPISGRTGRSLVTPGALVSANQAPPLTTVSQLDPVYVDVTQSSAELLRLRRAALSGQIDRSADVTRAVGLVLEDGSRYTHEGTLRLAEVAVDATTGAVTLRAEFPNPEGLLLPGMYVRAILTEGLDAQAILVPQPALTRNRQGRGVVRIVNEDGRTELREVVATRTVGSSWLVEDGLRAGDVVIVEGGQNTRPDTAVRISAGQ